MARVEDVVIKIRTDDGQLNSGLDKAERKLSDFGNAGKKIMGLIGGAFAVERVAAFTFELAKLSGEAEGVRAAFQRIAKAQDLKAMQEATKGTVSELNLMKRAVSANNLGLPIENLASLFEFATKRAQDTGESVDYLVESIVTGIGRKSPLILDNLGISAVQLREKLKGVGYESASVADIAAAVGEIAADSMRESGEVIDTNAVKIQQLSAQWADFKLSLAENEALNNYFSGTLSEWSTWLEVVTHQSASFWDKFHATFDVTGRNATAVFNKLKAQEEQQRRAAEAIDEYNRMIEQGKNPMKETVEQEEKRLKTLGDLKEELKKMKESLDTYGIGQTAELQRTLQQIEATEKLIKSLMTLKTVRAEPGEMMQTRGETPQIGAAGSGGDEILMPEFDKLDAYGEAYLEKYGEMMAEVQDEVELLNAAVNAAIVDGLVGGLEALVNGANFGGVMSALLSPLASILEQQGKILLAAGIGLEVFKQSLSTLNGPAAIAQGAILIGLAQGMKALGNIGSGGGASGGSYSSAIGGGAGTGPGNFIDRAGRGTGMSINITGELTAQGSSLKYVLDQVNWDDKITRTGN
jgi:hypothetical protein